MDDTGDFLFYGIPTKTGVLQIATRP